jgi:hypothetical protein
MLKSILGKPTIGSNVSANNSPRWHGGDSRVPTRGRGMEHVFFYVISIAARCRIGLEWTPSHFATTTGWFTWPLALGRSDLNRE